MWAVEVVRGLDGGGDACRAGQCERSVVLTGWVVGWCAVPIPVVASFRKIKNLVKNHGVVAAALRNSTQLVSECGY